MLFASVILDTNEEDLIKENKGLDEVCNMINQI